METSPDYNPNAAANPDGGIFGLPFQYQNSKLIYLPIPWEATTSYGGGTVFGPQAILDASPQLDLFDLDVINPDRLGLYALPISEEMVELNQKTKQKASAIKDVQGEVTGNRDLEKTLSEVNRASDQLNQKVYEQTLQILKDGKIAALIGGDHSVPFGAFQAAGEHFQDFGILHFDAHSDTRKAFMGFEHSHASIMYNASTKIPKIKQITQVGIRDFCEDEFQFTSNKENRFTVFYDQWLSDQKLQGRTFQSIADEIVKTLPQKVWVSFDIDGLDPRFCPHTGTPVPGGLDYPEVICILRALAKSGKNIIGFDVVEVAPPLLNEDTPAPVLQAKDEWDANVGMRLIYKLSALTLASQGLAKWR